MGVPEPCLASAVYFVQGILGLARLAISFFYKDEFQLDPATVKHYCSYGSHHIQVALACCSIFQSNSPACTVYPHVKLFLALLCSDMTTYLLTYQKSGVMIVCVSMHASICNAVGQL